MKLPALTPMQLYEHGTPFPIQYDSMQWLQGLECLLGELQERTSQKQLPLP